MRVISVKNLNYFRTGGGLTTERAIYRQLAKAGHQAIWVGTLLTFGPAGGEIDTEKKSLDQLRANGINVDGQSTPFVFNDQGVEVHILRSEWDLPAYVKRLVDKVQPDWLVGNSHNSLMLTAALLSLVPSSKFVIPYYSSHAMPFGPDALVQDPDRTALFRRARGSYACSDFVRRYVKEHAGIDSKVLYLPVFGSGPFEKSNDTNGYILMVNPSRIKGADIFIGLAKAMPHLRFAAIRSWATEPDIARDLESLPNITLLDSVPNTRMHEIYSRARVLLAPSLWEEGFGLVIVEAMLRGIPVLASNTGGIAESKLGVPYILPVKPQEAYAGPNVERTVPKQDIEPWKKVLELLQEPKAYEELSAQSYKTANAFVAGIPESCFADYLASLT